MAATPARSPEESRELFDRMQGLDASPYQSRSVRTMREMIPRCAECGNSLLPQSRGLCQKDHCGSFICLRSPACHKAHEVTHRQAYYDKLALDTALRGFTNKTRAEMRKRLERRLYQGPNGEWRSTAPAHVEYPGMTVIDESAPLEVEPTPFPVMTEQEKANAGLAL